MYATLESTNTKPQRSATSKKKAKAKVHVPGTRDRQMFALLRIVQGHKGTDVASRAKISPSTVYKWRKHPKDGGTVYPKMHTMELVLSAFGYTLEVVKKDNKKEK